MSRLAVLGLLALAACTPAQQAVVATDIQSNVTAINSAIANACTDFSAVATEAQLLAGLTSVAAPVVGASISTIIGTVNGVCAPPALQPNVASATSFDLSTALWIGQNTGTLRALVTQAKAAQAKL